MSDDMLIFEMFPNASHNSVYHSSIGESTISLLQHSKNPLIKSALTHLHEFQKDTGHSIHPEGYLLFSRNGDNSLYRLPEEFQADIFPRLKVRASKSPLTKWILEYDGISLTELEDPSKSDRFLYGCLWDLKINSYFPQISQNAISLLEKYGGKREIKALGNLSATVELSGHSEEISKAWRSIRELYNVD